MEPSTGVYYPFITDHLAASFGAYVLQPEHRFYGESQPISRHEIDEARAEGRPDPRRWLLTTGQALRDAVRLVRYIRDRLRCSRDRFSRRYCPVISVGGSYPGFMSAMARLRFPEVVDMAYAASPPMKFYSQQMKGDAYYQHVSHVANQAVLGCAPAVRNTLELVQTWMLQQSNIDTASQAIGACPHSLPAYIQSTSVLWDEVLMMAGYTFANHNMAYYPPSSTDTMLAKSCHIFLNASSSTTPKNEQVEAVEKLKRFFVMSLPETSYRSNRDSSCFDMIRQLPSGPNATISAGDWSGVGTGGSGESWDFQTCTLLVERIAFPNNSMFPPRPWTLDWMTEHCQARFGVTPNPTELVERWHFDQLMEQGVTRILFTNGLNDGWSVAGIPANLSKSLLAINFPNGAHHSDLSYGGPKEDMTEDIASGRLHIQAIFGKWLQELPGGNILWQNQTTIPLLRRKSSES